MYCSLQLLQCGGNLYDVVSLAVKAALYNTKYVYCLLLIKLHCTLQIASLSSVYLFIYLLLCVK